MYCWQNIRRLYIYILHRWQKNKWASCIKIDNIGIRTWGRKNWQCFYKIKVWENFYCVLWYCLIRLSFLWPGLSGFLFLFSWCSHLNILYSQDLVSCDENHFCFAFDFGMSWVRWLWRLILEKLSTASMSSVVASCPGDLVNAGSWAQVLAAWLGL